MTDFYFFHDGPFSMWSPHYLRSDFFRVDGEIYESVKHFMAASKAAYFGDDKTLNAIQMASSSARQQALELAIEGLDEEKWLEVARGFRLPCHLLEVLATRPSQGPVDGHGRETPCGGQPGQYALGNRYGGRNARNPRSQELARKKLARGSFDQGSARFGERNCNRNGIQLVRFPRRMGRKGT
jgi:hypothetical protein